MAADTCRLCLGPVDIGKCTDLVTETTKLAMLKDILPEVNLDISENTQVCTTCVEQLETSYNFKHGVVVNEAKIQTKLEENKLKKIDLKLMLGDVAAKDLKKSDYICRTCLSICRTPNIRLFNSPSNMMPYSFVKKMCEVVFELEFIASVKPVLCDDCWETLQTVYNFRKSCLRTDKRLRIYVASNNVTKLSIDEFKKFTEENPVKEEDEDSSDEELDGCIKDEPLDNDDELKLDPDEASCSSSSVKVKEETEIKSESELNSDDEDMEDEPELLDPKAVKTETNDVDGEDCKMEIGDVKVDAEGEDTAGPSGLLEETHKDPAPNLLNSQDLVPKFQCDKCSFKTNLRGSFSNHGKIHAAPGTVPIFHCTECTYKSRYKGSLKYHKLVHVPKDILPKFQCPKCPYETIRQRQLKSHIVIHAEPGTLRMYHCAECPYKTNFKSALIRHVVIHGKHDSAPTYCCTECTYRSKFKERLRNHKLIHAPTNTIDMLEPSAVINNKKKDDKLAVPKFQCSKCSYKTNIQGSFRQHELIHAEPGTIPIYRCTECTFKSIYKGYLKIHKLIHAPENTVPKFQCAKCSYQTNRKSRLKEHAVVHAEPGTVPIYRCSECTYQSLRKNNLNAHKVVHMPKDIFECAHCSYKTNRRDSLITHLLVDSSQMSKKKREIKQIKCNSKIQKKH